MTEIHFPGTLDFGRRIVATIPKNGDGIDQLFLKFVLPQLPYGLLYKDCCVYDLIDELTLEIGGKKIIELNSRSLRLFDTLKRNINDIKICSKIIDNTVIYPFDLKYFFGKSKTDNAAQLGDNFEGVRLVDLNYHETRLYLKIGNIIDLINIQYVKPNTNQLLGGLSLVGVTIIGHYDNFATKPNAKITQSTCSLYYDNVDMDSNDAKSELTHTFPKFNNETKIALHSHMLNDVKSFVIQLNGVDCIKENMKIYKKMYDYNNNTNLGVNTFIISLTPKLNDIITLRLVFSQPLSKFNMSYAFLVNSDSVYQSGKFNKN